MQCVCGHEMIKSDWNNKWVCKRCGRTKPIEVTVYDYIRNLTVCDMAEFLEKFIRENVRCPDAYEIQNRLNQLHQV